MGNGIILTDDDIIEISELLDESHPELKKKLDAIVTLTVFVYAAVCSPVEVKTPVDEFIAIPAGKVPV